MVQLWICVCMLYSLLFMWYIIGWVYVNYGVHLLGYYAITDIFVSLFTFYNIATAILTIYRHFKQSYNNRNGIQANEDNHYCTYFKLSKCFTVNRLKVSYHSYIINTLNFICHNTIQALIYRHFRTIVYCKNPL